MLIIFVIIDSFPSEMSLGKYTATVALVDWPKSSGTHVSLGKLAGESIPIDHAPSKLPQRHVAGDNVPHQNVAGEKGEITLGNGSIVVVISTSFKSSCAHNLHTNQI